MTATRQRNRLRMALSAVAVSVLATLAWASTALAGPTGSITGTVTEAAAGHAPIAGVLVCAVSENFEEETEEFCDQTDGLGKYTLAELPEAEYTVEFLAAANGLNYAYQAWHEKPNRFEANPVGVGAGEVSGIDAELVAGGSISGRVTSFYSGLPISGVEVCAEESNVGEEGCAVTDTGGNYAIIGLVADEYRVEFIPPESLEYLIQYFNGEPGILQADPVDVKTGQVTPNVDATLLEGGQIGGAVIDAVTHAPVARVDACAVATIGNEYLGSCASSDASGHYLIRRVPPGVYTVRYFVGESAPGGYRPAWYTGGCNRDPVAVTVARAALTAGVDVGLYRSDQFSAGLPECGLIVDPPPPPPRKKALKCRKGFKRKKVRGKPRCVKVHKHKRHHHKRHSAR